jgi:hypothetical protein
MNTIDRLWLQVKDLPVPTRDLLALIDAATRHADRSTFNAAQRDTLLDAFLDLSWGPITYGVLDHHIKRFAKLHIDIMGPIRGLIHQERAVDA